MTRRDRVLLAVTALVLELLTPALLLICGLAGNGLPGVVVILLLVWQRRRVGRFLRWIYRVWVEERAR